MRVLRHRCIQTPHRMCDPQIIALSLNVLGLRIRTVKRYVYVRL